jgi:hypothetical protein
MNTAGSGEELMVTSNDNSELLAFATSTDISVQSKENGDSL